MEPMHSWVEEYSLRLLEWARRKTGGGDSAQELVQEVWLQFFAALRREEIAGRQVEQPVHLLWKVARYTWCHRLRKTVLYRRCQSLDEETSPQQADFAEDLARKAEEEQRMEDMRRHISRLAAMQRDILVFFYVDGLSCRQIAERLSLSETAVKWHLFDTRQKLRKEMEHMENENFVYRPHVLRMAFSGEMENGRPDTDSIRDSLLRQNICLLCYRQEQTADSLCRQLGVPRAYVDFDLDWLERREFLLRQGNRYKTAFVIESAQGEQDIFGVHLKHPELCEGIADGLLAAEADIRRVGFYGCDQPMGRLLWWMINRFCSYALQPMLRPLYMEPPLRPDGGRYYALGYDRTDPETSVCLDRSGWACNGSMEEDGFRWIGLYTFGNSEIQDMIEAFTPGWEKRRELLKQMIRSNGYVEALQDEQREELAALVEKGFLRMENGRALPNFCVFTDKQYQQLAELVFRPLADRLSGALKALYDDLSAHCAHALPMHLDHLQPMKLYDSLLDLGFVTTIRTFERGLLYKPASARDGEFLTLLYRFDPVK